MKFNSTKELLKQARKDGACKGFEEWVSELGDLRQVFNQCCADWRRWALHHRYEQFANKDFILLQGDETLDTVHKGQLVILLDHARITGEIKGGEVGFWDTSQNGGEIKGGIVRFFAASQNKGEIKGGIVHLRKFSNPTIFH